MKIIVILLINIFLQISQCSPNSNIVFVYEHVRHGARSPLFADGNKHYTDHFGTKWEGPSTLTAVGKRTHYIIGIQNRIKYSSLINYSKLISKEIQIFSTNSVRTLQSIQAELQAMYLPGTLEPLTEQELVVAFPPIHNISIKVLEEIKNLNHSTIINGINVFPIQFSSPKKLRLNEPEYCPYMSKYQAQLEKNMKNEINVFLKHFDEKYGEKLQKYFNKTNRDFMYDFDFIELVVAEEFICNYFQGNNFSDFINKTEIDIEEFFNYTKKIKNYYIFHINIDEKTGVMAASPQMKEIINYMDAIIQNKSQAPKMIIHGGHDTTINCIQYFMHYAFQIPITYIPFAANIFFELHKNESSNNFYVEYIFDGISLLSLDYDKFREKVLESIWSEEKINNFCNFEQEDKSESDSDKFKTISLILLITNAVFFISTVIFMSLFIYNCKKNKKKYSLNLNDSILAGVDKENN